MMELNQTLGKYKEIESVYKKYLHCKFTLNENIQNIMFSALID
jgi:hypothetical protein